ncbi:circadian clock-controlled protein daywake-like [Glossina fuscipes fuscipes]
MLKIAYYLSGVLMLSSICEIFCAILPSNIPKCKISDNACVAASINEVFRLYPKGSPAFGLDDISRITVPEMVLGDGNGQPSSAQLTVKFENLIFTGVEKSVCLNVSGFEPETTRVEVNLIIPLLKIKADYAVNGKILLFTLKGKGKSEIHLKDVDIKLTVDVDFEKRENQTFVIIKDMIVSFEPKNFYIHLDNLFDGNKELTDSVNDVINENWRDIFHSLQDAISQAYYDALKPLLKKIFKVLPYDEFYKN